MTTSSGGGYLAESAGYLAMFLVTACLTVAGGLLFWAFFGIPRGEYARAPIQGPSEGVDGLCSLSFVPLSTPTISPSSSATSSYTE